jgi:DNA-directed RNA polymerase specialized sigma24 family protein
MERELKEQLLEEYKEVVFKAVQPFIPSLAPYGYEYSDLINIAYMKVWDNLDKYMQDLTKITTFIWTVSTKAMYCLYRDVRRIKRNGKDIVCIVDSFDNTFDTEWEQPVRHSEKDMFVDYILTIATPMFIDRFSKNISVREIKEKYHYQLSKQTLNLILNNELQQYKQIWEDYISGKIVNPKWIY